MPNREQKRIEKISKALAPLIDRGGPREITDRKARHRLVQAEGLLADAFTAAADQDRPSILAGNSWEESDVGPSETPRADLFSDRA